MPVVPNLVERLLLFRLNEGPAPALDLFGAAAFRSVGLALEVDLFERLREGPARAGELADALGADERTLRALLGFLAAEGYLDVDGERYELTASTRRWLTDAEGTNLAPWFAFWADVAFPFWEEQAERALREGEPSHSLYDWLGDDPERWRATQAGFRATAAVTLEPVLARLPPATRLLDVGGGHGLFAAELCRRRPGTAATVVDLPGALDAARETAVDRGVEDRVALRGGDYLTDELADRPADLALVFNVVHAHDPAENRLLFSRVAGALRSGGHVAVLDQFEGTGPTPVSRAGVAFVGLAYRVLLGARTYPAEDVEGWLRGAGFEDVRRHALRRAPGVSLLVARKGQ